MNNLLMEVENEIAVVTINRPKSLNALNSEFPVEQFHKMGELGLVGLPYPKEVGGQGADYLAVS